MLTTPTPARPADRLRRTRDPERTRARILAAAVQEFAAKGFAGARVARIARRARVNKRMLYHYFGNKDDLFRAILGQQARRAHDLGDGGARRPRRVARVLARRRVPRHGLGAPHAVGGARDRARRGDPRGRAAARRRLGRRRDAPAPGSRACSIRTLDPAQTLLSMVALTTFPVAFPQIARLLTGLDPTDPASARSGRRCCARSRGRSAPPPDPAPAALHDLAREEIAWHRRWRNGSRRCRRS